MLIEGSSEYYTRHKSYLQFRIRFTPYREKGDERGMIEGGERKRWKGEEGERGMDESLVDYCSE